MTIVTSATPEHIEDIIALANEMNAFYGATETEPIDLQIQQINSALFSSPPVAHSLLAWEDKKIVGMAAYSFLWPAVGLTQSLFLKELYVVESHRSTGVGRLLMQRLFQTAIDHDCSRVEWATDLDNAKAQKFYEQLGVPQDGSKVFYRLQGEDLLRVAECLGLGPSADCPELDLGEQA